MTDEPEQTPARRKVKDRPLPVVLMFQPTVFEFVSGDRLEEWEQAIRENVFHGTLEAKLPGTAMVGSWSGCPTFDECDQLQN